MERIVDEYGLCWIIGVKGRDFWHLNADTILKYNKLNKDNIIVNKVAYIDPEPFDEKKYKEKVIDYKVKTYGFYQYSIFDFDR